MTTRNTHVRTRIGTSGWIYPPWRGVFYPKGLVQRRELEYLAERLDTVEINGSFYILQRASSYRTWAERTPDDFVFAVKGGRFVTHMKKLRGVEEALANFFASGPLALGPSSGPSCGSCRRTWATTPSASRTSCGCCRAPPPRPRRWPRATPTRSPSPRPTTDADRPLRHAMEVRHASYRDPAFVDQLRRYGVALVVADTAGTFPRLDDVTADLVYVRLHGDTELYASGYAPDALDRWAAHDPRLGRRRGPDHRGHRGARRPAAARSGGARRRRLLRQRHQGARAVRRDGAAGAVSLTGGQMRRAQASAPQ